MSLIENIKLSEGFRSRVYKCTEGYDTIGYGFAIKDLHMDEDIATMILERKVQDLKLKIQQKFPFTRRYTRCYYRNVFSIGDNWFFTFQTYNKTF